jgi:hypothetical protein
VTICDAATVASLWGDNGDPTKSLFAKLWSENHDEALHARHALITPKTAKLNISADGIAAIAVPAERPGCRP